MENYITIRKVVETKTPLTRKPTAEELAMIKEDEFFDLPDGLIDWDKEKVCEEDYSYANVDVVINNKTILQKRGRY